MAAEPSAAGGGVTPAGAGGANTGGANAGGLNGMAGALFNPPTSSDGMQNTCGGNTYRGEARELDMYIMLDRSSSMIGIMGPADVWAPITSAISSFLRLPEAAGISVGIQFFGINFDSCDPEVYRVPAATIAPLPGNAQAIDDAMLLNVPLLGVTPTLPAVTGAVLHARDHALANPGKKVIVVLATDGIPNGCGSDIANVAAAAADGLNGSPSIETYVVGIGDVAGLNQIAMAGGSGTAFQVDHDPAVAAAQFLDVMNTIRGQALPCDYAIPAEAGADPTKVNLDYTPPGGMAPMRVGYATSADECGSDLGWYYDNPTSPTRAIACPATCETLKQSTGAQVQVVVGCEQTPIR